MFANMCRQYFMWFDVRGKKKEKKGKCRKPQKLLETFL